MKKIFSLCLTLLCFCHVFSNDLIDMKRYAMALGIYDNYGKYLSDWNNQKAKSVTMTSKINANIKAETAYSSLLALSEKNNDALYLVAVCYQEGIYVERDCRKAFEIWSSLEKENHIPSVDAVGHCYQRGIGVQQDNIKAIEYFERAAGANYARAQYNLAKEYQSGNYISQNAKKAKEYFEKSAKLGFDLAQIELSNMYEKQEYFNKKQSSYWLERAAKKENYDAMYTLVLKYMTEQNKTSYLQTLQKAINGKHIESCLLLSSYYADGNFMEKDKVLSSKYYRLAQDYQYEKSKKARDKKKKTEKELSAKLNSNDPNVLLDIGNFYYNEKKELKKAYGYYLRAVEQGNIEAYLNLATIYREGIIVDRDISKALFCYKAYYEQRIDMPKEIRDIYNAALGISEHLSYIDQWKYKMPWPEKNIFNEDDCKKISHEEALNWYFEFAKNNDPFAQYVVGYCYHYLYRKDEQAVYWLKKSSEQQFAPAIDLLGVSCLEGWNDQDSSKALDYFKKASGYNYSYGYYHLGKCYLTGNGCKQDKKKGISYIETACDFDLADAHYLYGTCLYKGDGINRNIDTAFLYFQRAENKINDSELKFLLGECYFYASGKNQDVQQAIFLYLDSQKQKNNHASVTLKMLSNEIGFPITEKRLPPDTVNFLSLYAKSKENDISSFINLAKCYQNAKGCQKNEQKAFLYFKKASEEGNSLALRELAGCYYYGQGTETDFDRAFAIYQSLAENDDFSSFMVAKMYENGEGCERNIDEALNYYQKSASLGNTTSKSILNKYSGSSFLK